MACGTESACCAYEVGDMAIGYATIYHGVREVDPEVNLDWTSNQGRWFLGLYSNDSDVKTERATGKLLSSEA